MSRFLYYFLTYINNKILVRPFGIANFVHKKKIKSALIDGINLNTNTKQLWQNF